MNKRQPKVAVVASKPEKKRKKIEKTNKDIRKVCILTGGGDAPGLNAVLRAFVKTATSLGLDVYGSEDGFDGLINPGRLVELHNSNVRGILPHGGSILGCSNRANPFAYPHKDARGREVLMDVSRTVIERLKNHEIDVLVLVGGDGTMSMGLRFMEMGVRVIGVPKTIDNDLSATDATFGLDTAVHTATWAIDVLHSTAEAHDRVMILEVMGRYAGWIALHAGIAGGANVILVPEIPYDVDRIATHIRRRSERGANFSIVVIGEGAFPKGGHASEITKGRKGHLPRLGGAGHRLMGELQGKVQHEIRATILGHLQRGGSPSPQDRLLGTRFGVMAAHLCHQGKVGRMVALKGTEVETVPLAAAIGQPKLVEANSEIVNAARAVGIEFGA